MGGRWWKETARSVGNERVRGGCEGRLRLRGLESVEGAGIRGVEG